MVPLSFAGEEWWLTRSGALFRPRGEALLVAETVASALQERINGLRRELQAIHANGTAARATHG